MLWSSFVPVKKVSRVGNEMRRGADDAPVQTADRLGMKMNALVEHVSKKPIPPWTKNLLVEVMVNDENDEDVEVSSCVGDECVLSKMSGSILLGAYLRREEGRNTQWSKRS